MDTLGHLLALLITPANEQERAQVGALAQAVQAVTGQNVEVAFVDQGYTGERPQPPPPARHATGGGKAVAEAKRGFVLLPRRWVVERSFAWAARFRRLAKDYERLPETVAGLHFLVFACLFLQQATGILLTGPLEFYVFSSQALKQYPLETQEL